MRKSVGSFIVLNRRALLLFGVVLILTGFCIVALQSRAQSNTGNSTPDADPTPETPSVGCTFGPGWTLEAPMPAHVQSPAATSDGTYGYVMGGFDNSTFQPSGVLVRYDPITGLIVLKLPLTIPVSQASAVYAPITNKIYLFGGTDGSFGKTNITQIYDIATDFWSLGTNMPGPGANMFSGYYNGKIYLGGGDDGNQVQSTLLRFDPLTGIFTNLPPIPRATTGAGFGMTSSGQLIVVGGNDAIGTPSRAVQVYDVDPNTWVTKLSPPVAVDYAASVMIPRVVVRLGRQLLDEGTLMVIGGGNAANPFGAGRTTQIYDPAMNTWSSGPNLNVGRYAPAGFTVGGKVFVVGGFDGTTTVGTIESLTINCPSASATVSGRVVSPNGTGLRNATVSMTDSAGVVRTATTSSFGFFSFSSVAGGGTFVFRVQSRLYRYAPVTVTINDNVTLPDFVGLE